MPGNDFRAQEPSKRDKKRLQNIYANHPKMIVNQYFDFLQLLGSDFGAQKPSKQDKKRLGSTARPRDTRILVPGKKRAAQVVLREVYIYVQNEIFFQKTVYLQGFCSKSAFGEVTPMY